MTLMLIVTPSSVYRVPHATKTSHVPNVALLILVVAHAASLRRIN